MAKPPPAAMNEPRSEIDLRNAIRRIERRLVDLEAFDPAKVDDRRDPNITSIERAIDGTLHDIFGDDGPAYHRYSIAGTLDTARHNTNGVPIEEIRKGLVHGRARAIALLKQAVRAFEERLEDEFGIVSSAVGSAAGTSSANAVGESTSESAGVIASAGSIVPGIRTHSVQAEGGEYRITGSGAQVSISQPLDGACSGTGNYSA